MKQLHFHIHIPPGYALYAHDDVFWITPVDPGTAIEGRRGGVVINLEELQRLAAGNKSAPGAKRKR